MIDISAIRLKLGRVDGELVSRQEIVNEARSWVGTPFMHQGTVKGFGCDCTGLLRGALLSTSVLRADFQEFLPAHAMGYSRIPDGATMRAGCDALLTRISLEAARPGDLALLEFKAGMPQHTAVLGDYVHGGLTLIHALGPGHPAKVVEHRIDNAWRKRIVATYAIPGVE